LEKIGKIEEFKKSKKENVKKTGKRDRYKISEYGKYQMRINPLK